MQDAAQLDATVVAEVLVGERNSPVANVAAAVCSGNAEIWLGKGQADADTA